MDEDAARSGTGKDAGADDAASATSARLAKLVGDEIDAAGGWIRFARFMELALYAPGLGYYSAGATKIGRDPSGGSDFVTAPALTPLFGRALARPVAQVLAGGGDTILELGGGTGSLAVDLLLELEALGSLPARYQLLDVSADLRERQRATIRRHASHLLSRVTWLDAWPDRIGGVVIGNEVLDALPVDLVVWDGVSWAARGVTSGSGGFAFADRPMSLDVADHVAALGLATEALPDGYLTETHQAARALVASLASRMTDDAVALFIDYGFPASEYYHSQRNEGTLMTHRAHRSSADPLIDVGLRDITAHVDFSGIARAAESVGARAIGYTSQSAFLIDCGIADLLRHSPADTRSWSVEATALTMLLSEAEMGELFKVIAIARVPRGSFDESAGGLIGFRSRDRVAAL